MPHATNIPPSGFQAIILCGPGVSLNTFTANPEEFPKALVPIANRPMVWYPLDWCYRMGITSEFSVRFIFCFVNLGVSFRCSISHEIQENTCVVSCVKVHNVFAIVIHDLPLIGMSSFAYSSLFVAFQESDSDRY